MPYGLEDLFRAEQTVYDIDPKYLSMIRDLSKEILMVSADIAEHAELPIMVVKNGLALTMQRQRTESFTMTVGSTICVSKKPEACYSGSCRGSRRHGMKNDQEAVPEHM